MNLLDFFRERKKKETPANIAKERLQIRFLPRPRG